MECLLQLHPLFGGYPYNKPLFDDYSDLSSAIVTPSTTEQSCTQRSRIDEEMLMSVFNDGSDGFLLASLLDPSMCPSETKSLDWGDNCDRNSSSAHSSPSPLLSPSSTDWLELHDDSSSVPVLPAPALDPFSISPAASDFRLPDLSQSDVSSILSWSSSPPPPSPQPAELSLEPESAIIDSSSSVALKRESASPAPLTRARSRAVKCTAPMKMRTASPVPNISGRSRRGTKRSSSEADLDEMLPVKKASSSKRSSKEKAPQNTGKKRKVSPDEEEYRPMKGQKTSRSKKKRGTFYCTWEGCTVLPFTREEDMHRHYRQLHLGIVGFCPYCPKELSRKCIFVINRHINSIHPNNLLLLSVEPLIFKPREDEV